RHENRTTRTRESFMKDDIHNDILNVNGLALRRRTFLGFLGGAIAASTLAGPGSALAAMGSTAILRVGANTNPSSLDPATGGSGSDHVFLFPMYDTLVTWDFATLQAQPGLATSWQFTDPKTLVMQLR